MVERVHILVTFIWVYMSGLQCVGSFVKYWEKTKECRVFCRARRVSASGKNRLCWKNILVTSVIALDSSFVPVGHQLYQWIPIIKHWTFSRFFAFMCKRAGTAQWGIPTKYNAWVWLVIWIYLTPRMVFWQNIFYPGSQNHNPSSKPKKI